MIGNNFNTSYYIKLRCYTGAGPDDYIQFTRKSSKFSSLKKKSNSPDFHDCNLVDNCINFIDHNHSGIVWGYKVLFLDSVNLNTTNVFAIYERRATAVKKRRKNSNFSTCAFFYLPDIDVFCSHLNRTLKLFNRLDSVYSVSRWVFRLNIWAMQTVR